MGRPFALGGENRFDLVDGQITGFVESDYGWEMVQWFRRLIDDGLFDPESFTHRFEIGAEKISVGRYAITPFFSHINTQFYTRALIESNPEMIYRPLGNMVNARGEDYMTINTATESFLMIAVTREEKVYDALRLINRLSTYDGRAVTAWGTRGVNWELDEDGYGTMTQSLIDNVSDDWDYYVERVIGGQIDLLASVRGADHPDANPFRFHRNPWAELTPETVIEMANNVAGTTPNIRTVDGVDIWYFVGQNPDLQTMLSWFGVGGLAEHMISFILAGSEEEARRRYEGFIDVLYRSGYGELKELMQREFDANPDAFVLYRSEV